MERSTLVTIFCLILLSQFPNVLANEENLPEENEIIKKFHDCDSWTFDINTKSDILPPSEPFPWDKIFKILEIFSSFIPIIGGSLLAWKVWNVIKRWRHGRPRDYSGLNRHGCDI